MRKLMIGVCAALAAAVSVRGESLLSVPLKRSGVVIGARLSTIGTSRCMPFTLYFAYGHDDAGDASVDGWEHVVTIGRYPAGTASVDAEYPKAFYDYGEDRGVVDFVGRFIAVAEGPLPTADDYVQDGLLAQWDGLDASATATEWPDRKNSDRVFAMTNVQRTENGYVLSGEADSCGKLDGEHASMVMDRNIGERTFELTFSSKGGNDSWVLFTAPESCSAVMCFWSRTGYIFSKTKQPTYAFSAVPALGEVDTWSVAYDGDSNVKSFCFDGKTVRPSDVTDMMSASPADATIGSLGTGASTYPFKGAVFSLRVYGRQLDAATAEYNAAVDAVRFGTSGMTVATDLLRPDICPSNMLKRSKAVRDADGRLVAIEAEVEGLSLYPSVIYLATDDVDRGGESTNDWASVVRVREVGIDETEIVVSIPDEISRTGKKVRMFVLQEPQDPRETADAYVQNGLLANWDGLVRDPGDSAWIDLVASRTMTLTGVTYNEDRGGYVFAGNAKGQISATDTAETFGKTDDSGKQLDKTVQIVMLSRGGTQSQVVLKSSDASNVAFGYAGHLITASAKSGKVYPDAMKPICTQYSLLYSSGVCESVYEGISELTVTSGGDYWGGSCDFTSVGRRDVSGSTPCPLTGEIYAIRVYSRQLNGDEIAQNAAVDANRRLCKGQHLSSSPSYSSTYNISVAGRSRRSGCSTYKLAIEPALAHPAFIYAVCGDIDAGENTNGWQHVCLSKRIDAGMTLAVGCKVPEAWDDGNEGRYMRFILVESNDAISETTYAGQDDLVAQWDGLADGFAREDEWRDVKDPSRTFALTGVVRTECGYSFAGNVNSYGKLDKDDGITVFQTTEDQTIELVWRKEFSNDDAIILKTPLCCGQALGLLGGSKMIISGTKEEHSRYEYTPRGGMDTFSALYAEGRSFNAYLNGEEAKPSGSDAWGQDPDGVYLGKRGTGGSDTPGKFELYSIRVYSRHLTLEELAFNRSIDEYRFGGKPTEPVENPKSYVSDIVRHQGLILIVR